MTVDALLAMEAGGADVIELGVPFSDPIADGPAIQESNVVSILCSPYEAYVHLQHFLTHHLNFLFLCCI